MDTGITQSSLLTPEQAAEKLGVTEHTLAVWRCSNRYELKYVKIGRLVRYRIQDIEDFIESRTTGGTSQNALCH